MRVESHLDFGKNAQIIQVTLHRVSSLPTGWKGGVVYLETDNKVYYFNGSSWIAINDTAGLITDIQAGAGITVTGSGGNRKVTFDPDNTTIELTSGDNGKARIKAGSIREDHLGDDSVTGQKINDGAVSAAKIGSKQVTTAKIADKAVGTAQLDQNAVTSSILAPDSVHTINIVDKQITFSKIQDVPTMTVVGRVAGGSGVTEGVTVLTSLQDVIANHDSLATAKAIREYVDNLVGGLGFLIGGWNAATSNNFPSGAKKGEYWYITADGTIQGLDFIEGDVIIANKDGASTTDAGDWIPLKTKRGQATATTLGLVKLATATEARAMADSEKALTPSNLADVRATNTDAQGSGNNRFITPQGLHNRTATESRRGIAQIATQAEVDAGADNSKIVTPAKLQVYVDGAMSVFGKYVADIGNGTATSYTVTHGFNNRDVMTEIFANDTGQSVLADVSRSSANAVVVSFAKPPTISQFRIIIKK